MIIVMYTSGVQRLAPAQRVRNGFTKGQRLPRTSAAVAGNASSELAKIGGITPPEFTRSGR